MYWLGEIKIRVDSTPPLMEGSAMKRTHCNSCFGLTGMRFARGIGLVFLSVLMAGCPASKEAPEAARDAGSEGKIIIKGSNTIGEELAPHLIAEYQKDHPTAQFALDTKGTRSEEHTSELQSLRH